MPVKRKILVIGGGGREHALAQRLARSASVGGVWVCPGNAGTEGPAGEGRASVANVSGEALEVARSLRPDLVVVGPEAPLCDGLADRLAAEDIACFGPTRAAARLEGSKVFMKRFAERHGLPTARAVLVDDPSQLEPALAQFPQPPVVKADGLCAGKGVIVASSQQQARSAALDMLRGEAFGSAGARVLLEERLEGFEVSVHAVCDGERVLVLPAAQDHKRIGEGDTGPNTGGMGTFAPTPRVDDAWLLRVRDEILLPTVRGMADEGTPFRGVLFAGLMVPRDGGPRLLEFNVRFGDPETQVLTAVADGDFAELLCSAAGGRLAADAVWSSTRHAVCVVLAAAGYPGPVRAGDAILGLGAAAELEGVEVFHAGTRREAGSVVTSGGRVLGVTGVGATLAQARTRAYEGVERIRFEGMQLRRDIGARALAAR